MKQQGKLVLVPAEDKVLHWHQLYRSSYGTLALNTMLPEPHTMTGSIEQPYHLHLVDPFTDVVEVSTAPLDTEHRFPLTFLQKFADCNGLIDEVTWEHQFGSVDIWYKGLRYNDGGVFPAEVEPVDTEQVLEQALLELAEQTYPGNNPLEQYLAYSPSYEVVPALANQLQQMGYTLQKS